jgi:hypothetical protein
VPLCALAIPTLATSARKSVKSFCFIISLPRPSLKGGRRIFKKITIVVCLKSIRTLRTVGITTYKVRVITAAKVVKKMRLCKFLQKKVSLKNKGETNGPPLFYYRQLSDYLTKLEILNVPVIC